MSECTLQNPGEITIYIKNGLFDSAGIDCLHCLNGKASSCRGVCLVQALPQHPTYLYARRRLRWLVTAMRLFGCQSAQ